MGFLVTGVGLADLGTGDRRLRSSVLFAVTAHCLSLIFLAAFMFIFLPLSLPAFVLAKDGRALIIAAILAGLASVAYFAFWLEILDELHLS